MPTISFPDIGKIGVRPMTTPGDELWDEYERCSSGAHRDLAHQTARPAPWVAWALVALITSGLTLQEVLTEESAPVEPVLDPLEEEAVFCADNPGLCPVDVASGNALRCRTVERRPETVECRLVPALLPEASPSWRLPAGGVRP